MHKNSLVPNIIGHIIIETACVHSIARVSLYGVPWGFRESVDSLFETNAIFCTEIDTLTHTLYMCECGWLE